MKTSSIYHLWTIVKLEFCGPQLSHLGGSTKLLGGSLTSRIFLLQCWSPNIHVLTMFNLRHGRRCEGIPREKIPCPHWFPAKKNAQIQSLDFRIQTTIHNCHCMYIYMYMYVYIYVYIYICIYIIIYITCAKKTCSSQNSLTDSFMNDKLQLFNHLVIMYMQRDAP